jgi:hypothetical protein
MYMESLSRMTEKELLIFNSEIMRELKSRDVIRTKNSPIADYCEWLVAKKFKWKLANSSNGGYDAKDSDGFRVQIKCRMIEGGKGTNQLGVIRNLDKDPFDYLVAVLFNERIEVVKGYKISKELIRKYSRFSMHQNGHILILKEEVLASNELIDITSSLQ